MKKIKVSSYCVLGLLPLFASCSHEQKEEKMNILWLFCEDISPWMPAYGDSTVQTPNIDFLAQNGVLFSNCYATASVSSASRSAIITGAMQTTTGMHNHRSGRTDKVINKLPANVQVLPQIFKRNGYYTYNAGKDDFNWQYDWNDYWSGPYTQNKFYGKEGKGSWNDRKEGQSFFGVMELYGGKNHGKVDEPVDINKIKVPPYYPDVPFMRKQLATHYNQIKLTDEEVGHVLQQMKKDGVYRNTMIIFLSDNGYLTLRDKQFLYDGGIHMPFIVSCPGNPQLLKKFGIEKGSVRSDMISLLDVTATTLAMAGIDRPKYMESKDIFAPDYHRDFIVAARDRCDFTIDRIRAIRTKDFKYIRNFMTDRPLLQPQYRDKKKSYKEFMKIWKNGVKFEDSWLSDKRPAEELYSLKDDPYETHNLAESPEYQDQLFKMRAILNKWIIDTDDKGQYPESEEALSVVYERWGDRCVNPEYDTIKDKFKHNNHQTK